MPGTARRRSPAPSSAWRRCSNANRPSTANPRSAELPPRPNPLPVGALHKNHHSGADERFLPPPRGGGGERSEPEGADDVHPLHHAPHGPPPPPAGEEPAVPFVQSSPG